MTLKINLKKKRVVLILGLALIIVILISTLSLMSIFAAHTCLDIKQPNIIIICGDDVGWGDVSLHGSRTMMTPNIDYLGLEGIVLENYYTDTQGTPSRSAMFTGKYPMHIGTQGMSITATEDRGLPITEKLLPSYLRDLGYATKLVGKWQQGNSREHYYPTNRGFDTFFGFVGSSSDYFTYNRIEKCPGESYFGLNFFDDLEPVQNLTGHMTNILTERAINVIKEHDTTVPLYLHVAHAAPHAGGGGVILQSPVDDTAANTHIAHPARRMYAGLMTGLDRCVGQIIATLAEVDILNNTLIIFTSDNGAATATKDWIQNYGSNSPLRGTKATPWEGAVRAPAFLWHAGLKSSIYKGLFHVTDWLPTLVSVAGGNVTGIDGVDQWSAITNDETPPRTSAIIAVDNLEEWGAYRDGDFKLIVGKVDRNTSEYYSSDYNKLRHDPPPYGTMLLECETGRIFREILDIPFDEDDILEKRRKCTLTRQELDFENRTLCVPTKVRGCIFNISADPLESNDLWDDLPDIVQQMSLRFRLLWGELVPRSAPVFDARSDPALYGYVWLPWVDNNEEPPLQKKVSYPFPLKLSLNEMRYYFSVNLNVFHEKISEYMASMTEKFMVSMQKLMK